MQLPKLGDLIGEQQRVFEHPPTEHLFVAGPPGSGKTSLAVLRARFVADTDQSVVLVTKNRMLATLASQLSEGRVTSLTMHKFVWKRVRAVLAEDPPQIEPYVFDWSQIMDRYPPDGSGPTLDHLVIDEGQNLPAHFFVWALRHGARTLSVFADEDQATEAATSRATLHDIHAAGLPMPVRLRENHRNTPEIARVAEFFHREGLLPPAIVRRPSGEQPRLMPIESFEALARMAARRMANRGGSIGIIVDRISEVELLDRLLRTTLPPGTRIDSYTSNAPAGAEDGIALLSPGVTVLTSEAVIGLEFDAVYLQDLSRSLPCETAAQAKRMYMLSARARDSLRFMNGPTSLTAEQLASLPPETTLGR